MSVFVDTSALLAVIDADDRMHADAARAWGELIGSDEILVTSNYVLLETLALLQRRFGVVVSRRFAEDALPALEVVWVDKGLHEAGVSVMLAAMSKGSPSLVDCISFEVIRRRGLDRVFAYDRHFKERGYRVVD